MNMDEAYPLGDLILSGNTLYSTTAGGGNAGNGTVFALGLPAPVLGIALVSNQVVISWPAWGSNFVLWYRNQLFLWNLEQYHQRSCHCRNELCVHQRAQRPSRLLPPPAAVSLNAF